MAFSYTNSKGQTYILHSKEVVLRGSGKTQRIFFFARDERDGALPEVPAGYTVIENTRTGLPILKKA